MYFGSLPQIKFHIVSLTHSKAHVQQTSLRFENKPNASTNEIIIGIN